MASRILGMGDIISLVEKAEQTFDKDIALSSAERLQEGLFTFEDYKNQIGLPFESTLVLEPMGI